MISHNFLLLTAVKLELATIEIFARSFLGPPSSELSDLSHKVGQ